MSRKDDQPIDTLSSRFVNQIRARSVLFEKQTREKLAGAQRAAYLADKREELAESELPTHRAAIAAQITQDFIKELQSDSRSADEFNLAPFMVEGPSIIAGTIGNLVTSPFFEIDLQEDPSGFTLIDETFQKGLDEAKKYEGAGDTIEQIQLTSGFAAAPVVIDLYKKIYTLLKPSQGS